jgi:hypothetical protein
MVNCGEGSLRLFDSCPAAMARTCPGGYEILGQQVSSTLVRDIKNAGMFRCSGP